MHWFESQIKQLDKLASAYLLSQRQSAGDIIDISADTRLKRSQFIQAVQDLVTKVGNIKHIKYCAAYHDGLILANSKQAPNMDAFGATIQESIRAAQEGAEYLGLGNIEQIVIVGADDKLAILSVGPLVLCISSAKSTNLASALSQSV